MRRSRVSPSAAEHALIDIFSRCRDRLPGSAALGEEVDYELASVHARRVRALSLRWTSCIRFCRVISKRSTAGANGVELRCVSKLPMAISSSRFRDDRGFSDSESWLQSSVAEGIQRNGVFKKEQSVMCAHTAAYVDGGVALVAKLWQRVCCGR